MIIFVHGVPDTPALWGAAIDALGLEAGDYRAPALPGFGVDVPSGFSRTKDAYANWLIQQMEAANEPIDLVGHDWGALLSLRAASLRPDLIRSWCVTNAVIDADYRGHDMARKWATPLLGELIMLGMRDQARMLPAMIQGGMPEWLAKHEVPLIDKRMRQSILKLYRSAKGLRFGGDWVADLKHLPKHGQLYWGETDPYVDLSFAQNFSKQWDVPLHIEKGAGHFACAERPESFANILRTHWARTDSAKE